MKKLISKILYVSVICLAAAGNGLAGEVEIRGTYGGVNSFWEKGHSLADFGVNAIFVGSYSIDSTLVARAKQEGAKVFTEFAVLNGERYVEEHPEAWPVDRSGRRSSKADWFMGVCPTDPAFRAWRMQALRELLRKYPLDGVWMDYVHWHAQFESSQPILPETCFCHNCLLAFRAATGVSAPPGGSTADKANWILEHAESSWRNWRCSVIAGWARDMKQVIQEERPGALLGLYHAPWTDEDFEGARRKILGLDFHLLSEVVDVFSPMVYHGRMGRPAGWVKEYVEWFCQELDIREGAFPKVWPIVQAADDPGSVSPAEFESVLRGGVTVPASGVMMFTVHAIARDPEKLAVMKKVYKEWEGRK